MQMEELFGRIKKSEPEIASKIIGYLLLKGYGEGDISQLALAPEMDVQKMIYKAKAELNQIVLKSGSPPVSPSVNSDPGAEFPQFCLFSPPVPTRQFMSPRGYQVTSPCSEQQQIAVKNNSDLLLSGYLDSVSDLQTQSQFLNLEEQMESMNLGSGGFSNNFCYSDAALGNLGVRTGRRHQNLPEFPVKTCHFFNKGYCRHGSSCRYYHGQAPEHFPQIFGHNSMDAANEDPVLSLEKLEMEIVELLKSRRREPVSIATLPLLYYDRYGKSIQADGYLTESQRHGKAGYSLTKLLTRLKHSIRVIDRPHGQHAVILAEDAPKYMENRNYPGPIVSGSRQIYLTFPAESIFSEDDVSNYFSNYGQVEDVRIPCQQKRMFGFVTFVSAETVKIILTKGNPHYVCGARVLVKPYRERSKLVDRKYQARIESAMCYSPHYIDMESELHSIPRGYATPRLLRKQIIEDQEQMFELERRHSVAQKPLPHPSFCNMDGLTLSEGQFHFPDLNFMFEAYNNNAAAGEKIKLVETNSSDQDSEGLNLPDSPFASAIATGISAII